VGLREEARQKIIEGLIKTRGADACYSWEKFAQAYPALVSKLGIKEDHFFVVCVNQECRDRSFNYFDFKKNYGEAFALKALKDPRVRLEHYKVFCSSVFEHNPSKSVLEFQRDYRQELTALNLFEVAIIMNLESRLIKEFDASWETLFDYEKTFIREVAKRSWMSSCFKRAFLQEPARSASKYRQALDFLQLSYELCSNSRLKLTDEDMVAQIAKCHPTQVKAQYPLAWLKETGLDKVLAKAHPNVMALYEEANK
jgi:hypothetical protein